MAAGAQNAWSTTPATNTTADTTCNWREGQSPSTVNDSARAMMAAIKKWLLDWQGALVTGGGSTAYTLTTNETLTLADGKKVTCRMHATSGAAPTLNVDSTGAVAIQSVQGTALPTGALLSGGIYSFTYYASAAAWIVNGLGDATAQVSAASDTAAGKVELATVAEAGAGTDTARAVTPAGLFPAKADVASGTTTNIGAAATSKVRITGTTTITAFDTVAAGIYREGYFEGALTFTHGSALLLPGGANITTAANDRFGALSLGSGNWIVLWYSPTAGNSLSVASQADAQAGSDNAKTMTALRVRQALGARAYAETTTYFATTDLATVIPDDDTIPQNTEGTQVLTASITPKANASRVRVRFTAPYRCSNGRVIAALFQDSVANALSVSWATAQESTLVLEFEHSPNTTSAVAYKVRIGPTSGNNMQLNGSGGARLFGGASRVTLVVEELLT